MRRPARLMVWMLALMPALLTLFSLDDLDWRAPAEVLTALGGLAGIAGLSFMLAAASLSSRVPGFDTIFGGLTKLWRTHHNLAAVSFVLLLFHPILLAFGKGDRLSSVVGTLFPPMEDWAVWAGWAALLVMMVFLAPSFGFFGRVAYRTWKMIHRLAGLAVVLSLLHVFPLTQLMPRPWAYAIWIALSVLAVAAVAYRWLFSRAQLPGRGGRFHYRVSASRKVANDVVELNLEPESRHLQYASGQFVYLRAYDKNLAAGYGEEHPYTLSSSPDESVLRLAIKNLGDASRAIQNIQQGSEVQIEGPYGAFFTTHHEEDSELWIAGGIGITPFLSRARYLRNNAEEVDIHLIYCVQDENRLFFREELEAIARELPGFVFHPHYFYREGPLNLDFVANACRNFPTRAVYVCGPEPLVRIARRLLLGNGLPYRRLKTEDFQLL